MAFSARSLNKIKADIDTTGFEWTDAKTLYDTNGREMVYTVYGIRFDPDASNFTDKWGTKDSYGLILEDCFLSVPSHMNNTLGRMFNEYDDLDPEVQEAMDDGKVGITIYPYKTKKTDGDCYSFRWVDL